VLPDALVEQMATPNREQYGLGLGTSVFPCGTFLGHGGSVNGTVSIAAVAPDGTRGVVLALNRRTGADPGLAAAAGRQLCAGVAP
jgi:hypothetical protein